ncbi:MAG TPA: hypothetical protein GX697_03485, partial [Firmicutes bacterium]|nr:hypothetical protein [Bacillota bacterium]
MKKLLVPVFLIFLFSLLIAGCRAKEDIGQKIGEKIVEGIVGNENVDIDIDDDKITVKGKDGETLTLGGIEWPDIDYIPEFKKGEIISASNDGQGNVMILFEKVAQADF